MTTATRRPAHRQPASPGRRRSEADDPARPPAARASLFAAPYVVFLAAIFAYPLVLAVWITFHDYFFAAPGVEVDRPFVGPRQLLDGADATPPCGSRSCNVGDLPGHQRAADGGPLAGAGRRAERGDPRTDVLPGLATTCPTSRRASRSSRSGCSCSATTAWSTSSSGRWRPTRRGWSTATLAMPIDRAVRDLEAAGVLHPALPRRAAERARRSSTSRRRWTAPARCAVVLNVTVPGRPAGHHARRHPGDHHRGEPVHRALPADQRRRARTAPRPRRSADVPEGHRAGEARHRGGHRQ